MPNADEPDREGPAMAAQPRFDTRRLLIRPRTPADTEACLAMDSDPEVTRFVSGPWGDPAMHRAFIEARTRGPYAPGLGYWAICRRSGGAPFIGWVLLIPAGGAGPRFEIGWRLRRDAWGRGYATEAAGPVLWHAFTGLGLPEVVAEIDPDNAASLRVAEKLGMRRRGTVTDQGRPALRYALRREEFSAATGPAGRRL
jgi:RimJ/RimL family protein N-acetyltransferase